MVWRLDVVGFSVGVVAFVVSTIATGGIDGVFAFVVCVLDCVEKVVVAADIKDVDVENADAVVIVSVGFVKFVWTFVACRLDVVGFSVGVVTFVVNTIATGGVDGVVVFVAFALDCIENVGVTVDRIDVDVENGGAEAV